MLPCNATILTKVNELTLPKPSAPVFWSFFLYESTNFLVFSFCWTTIVVFATVQDFISVINKRNKTTTTRKKQTQNEMKKNVKITNTTRKNAQGRVKRIRGDMYLLLIYVCLDFVREATLQQQQYL